MPGGPSCFKVRHCVGGKLLTAEFAEESAEDAEKDKNSSGIWNIFLATSADFALRSRRSRALSLAMGTRVLFCLRVGDCVGQ